MDLKQISFQVNIKDPKDTTRDFPIQRAYTNDLNSVRLTFEMIDTTAAELSGATASILFYMLDRSFFQDTATVTGNKVEYTLTEAQGNHAGMAQVQIMVTVGGVVYASAKRKFDIASGLEMAVATEVMIKDWTMLTAEARAYLDEFAANEVTRQQTAAAAESARAQTFTTNEAGRQSTFEANEVNRQTKEAERQASETSRTTAETGRVNAESSRVTAEQGRITAELDRITSEEARVTGYAQMNARITNQSKTVQDLDSGKNYSAVLEVLDGQPRLKITEVI